MKKDFIRTPAISDILSNAEISRTGSWCWVRSDFAADFAAIRDQLDEKHGERLWDTRTKYVNKYITPSGREVVYKTFRKLKFFAGFLTLSASGREALNYAMLEAEGFPVATVLAAGELRCGLRLRHAFLMTGMVQDAPDCRDFMPGGKLADDRELCENFRCEAGTLLGRLHRKGIMHGGYTPFNLLYRTDGAERVDFTMIDVASCRKIPGGLTAEQICSDMSDFLRFFDYSPAEEDQVWACCFASAGISGERAQKIRAAFRPKRKKF